MPRAPAASLDNGPAMMILGIGERDRRMDDIGEDSLDEQNPSRAEAKVKKARAGNDELSGVSREGVVE